MRCACVFTHNSQAELASEWLWDLAGVSGGFMWVFGGIHKCGVPVEQACECMSVCNKHPAGSAGE